MVNKSINKNKPIWLNGCAKTIDLFIHADMINKIKIVLFFVIVEYT